MDSEARSAPPTGGYYGDDAPAVTPVVRVLLVEDHAIFRELLASVFEQEPGFEVIAQAGSLAEA